MPPALPAFQTIQLLVAPVVMISACGLLCLALYNRLMAIVTRARLFHKERFDCLTQLSDLYLDQQTSDHAKRLRARVHLLDDQASRILRRGVLIRDSLLCLISTVLCMLTCSISLGLSMIWPAFAGLALWLFILGVVVMMAAMILAILELARSLDPVTIERAHVHDMRVE